MKLSFKIILTFLATFIVYMIDGGVIMDGNLKIYYISYLRNNDETADFAFMQKI